MTRHVLAAVMFVLAGAMPAFAQSAETKPAADTYSYTYRAFAGFVHYSDGNGVQIGAGAATKPFENKQLEAQGDLSLMGLKGSGKSVSGVGIGLSANLLYDPDTKLGEWNPFIGAGFAVSHVPTKTSPGLQLLAGAEKPSKGTYRFRGEVRIGIFADFVTWSFLGGVSF